MALHVIVGKGPVGSATARLLAAEGHTVRLVSRSGAPGGATAEAGGPVGAVEHVRADATDAAALAQAAHGAAALYNCANPAYHRWPTDWPPMATAMLDAAERTGAVLVTTGNLYVYGPVDRPMHEALPLAATGVKSRVRAAMWADALARHDAGRVRVTEARASDFLGPEVLETGHLGSHAVPAVLRGKTVRLLGNPDMPHSWTYVPDVATILVRLAGDERAWGRAWHVPTAPAYSQREAVHRMGEIAGTAPKVAQMPWWAVRAAGLASPLLREMQETRYQFDRPFVLDSSLTERTFGTSPTPAGAALATTVRWWQQRLAEGTAASAGSAAPPVGR